MAKKHQSVEDVVEALGFGQAQIRNLLAHGVWFLEGGQIQLSMNLLGVVAAELQLTNTQQASLSSLIFLGIAMGTLLGGYLSDKIGRVPPLMLSYLTATLSHLLSATVSSYSLMALLRLTMGIGHGLGMPPSLAYVSEVTPASSRVMLQGVRAIIFVFGQIFAALFFIVDDPDSIMGLHWRKQIIASALVFGLLGLTTRHFLHESPVFLARMGRHAESQVSLAEMRRMNGRDGASFVSIEYEVADDAPEGGGNSRRTRGGWREGLGIVFGHHLALITMVLVSGSFVANIVLYGHLYAFPKIMADVESTVMPGYQNLMQSLTSVCTYSAVTAFAVVTSCRCTLALAGVLGAVGPMLLAWTASLEERTSLQEMLYLVAQNVPTIAAACAFLSCFQSSVELYPARVKATSAAVVLASGRIAAIIAPFLCQAMGSWKSFYELMSVLSLFLLVLTVAVLFRHLPTPAEVIPVVVKA